MNNDIVIGWAVCHLLAKVVEGTEPPASGTPSGGGPANNAAKKEQAADRKNMQLSIYLASAWACIIGTLFAYKLMLDCIRYVRMVICLNSDNQCYFAIPHSAYGKVKRLLLDAPLIRTRHHREFRLSAAINVGTLPSRPQSLALFSYGAINIAFCVLGIDWSADQKTVLVELRNRTGVLSVMNMLPLVLLAGRNNPLLGMLNISFDTFNLLHRWIGRIVVLEALAHTLAWMINKVHTAGWSGVKASFSHSQLILTGLIGMCTFLALLLHSPSIVRHAFYETFLHVHIVLAVGAMAAVWVHLKTLPQRSILVAVIALWVFERSVRLTLIIYRNLGRQCTKATIEVLPGDAVRVTLSLARPWTFQPGQHVYLYIPRIGWWTSHPFSLAWSEEEDDLSEKGLIMNRQDILERRKTSLSLVIRRRTGFTDKLYMKAAKTSEGRFTTSALVEGPYGSENFNSYGTVVLFAAGIGITHQLPHLRSLITSFELQTCAVRRITLIWVIQTPEHLEWIRPWMTSILALPGRRELLKIKLFVTRPRSMREVVSPSSSVQMVPGRPNVQALLDQEIGEQIGAMALSVCGTGSLSDDVRRAVRMRHQRSNIDFFENAFSW